jgi:type IV pilus assembly protein PilE
MTLRPIRRSAAAGFTLIEVLVVMVIAAILATVALPSYSDFVLRSRRAEARAMLNQAALWMERNQAATFRYNTDPSGTAVNDAKLSALGYGRTPETGEATYLLGFVSGPAAGSYAIAATPQGSQVQADAACGGNLAVDHVGQRGVWRDSAVKVDAASEACWRR